MAENTKDFSKFIKGIFCGHLFQFFSFIQFKAKIR
jgi:hypothetical protein